MLVFNVQISPNLLKFRLRVKNLVFQDQNLSKFWLFTGEFVQIWCFYVKIYQHSEVLRQNVGV